MMQRVLYSFLKWFFKHLYTTIAWAYDIVAGVVSLGRWREWVLTVISDLKLKEALEIGFGPGHLQMHLNQMGIRCFGIDVSPQMVRIAQRRLNQAGYVPRIVQGCAEEMPFRDACVSNILLTFPSEFIFAPATHSELRRVLKPEGELLIIAMAKVTGRNILDRVAAALFRVTGQTKVFPENWERFFREVGLEPKLELLDCKRSIVYRIRCTKIDPVAPSTQDA